MFAATGYTRSYHARSTGKLMPVGMNYLSDLVVRPGIKKKMWPLLLYKGSMYPGHAHRLWNYCLLMFAAEAETLADGLKLYGNASFAQLCGTPRRPSKVTLSHFFTRLHSSPEVTDNIPGFTEYVKMMGLGPCRLERVPLVSGAPRCAPWRISVHPNPGQEAKEHSITQTFYPFVAHNPKRPDDGKDLVLAVNEVVPKGLPEDLRADICQEMVMAVLEGKLKKENLKDQMLAYMRKGFKDIEWSGWAGKGMTTIAASSPMNNGDNRTFGEVHGVY